MRVRAVLTSTLCFALLLGGCGNPDDLDEKELLRAIDRTERLSHQFIFEEDTDARETRVQGLVEDDLRYKVRVTVNGTPALEETVIDDVLAVRLLSPAVLGEFVPKKKSEEPPKIVPPKDPKAEPGTAANPLQGGLTRQALEAGRWVIDRTGAPQVVAVQVSERVPGDDIVYDALTTLSYLRDTARNGAIRKFNEDALDYRPDEDPFVDLKPNKDEGEKRFDFVRPLLPRLDQANNNAAALPSERNFRFMAVFVNGEGRITKVLERIQVNEKLLEKVRTFSRAFVKEKFPNALASFDQAVKDAEKLPLEAQAAFFIQGINIQRVALGEDPIRLRSMSVEFLKLGEDVSVVLPTDATLEGDLSVLINRGRAVNQPQAAVSNSGSSTTTTVVSGNDPASPFGESPVPGAEGGGGEAPADSNTTTTASPL